MSRFKLRIDGPAGKIETVIDDPGPDRKGLALIAHPHPLHGGSLENKVVKTIGDTLFDLGYVAVRPNFRGVGQSEGEYDQGQGEVQDMLAVHEFVSARYPGMPLILAGFSFGAYVQTVVSERLHPKHLLLVGPAVNMFHMGEAPPHTIVIHGEHDEVAPTEAARDWAARHGFVFAVVRDTDHFFHKKLSELKEHILQLCPC
ncbi:MAG: alpha/beta hydrolase [Hydrogenophilaceae bacterium]|nr:alpha/beta hydrolase [Hydrogenophilaceae bacterium]